MRGEEGQGCVIKYNETRSLEMRADADGETKVLPMASVSLNKPTLLRLRSRWASLRCWPFLTSAEPCPDMGNVCSAQIPIRISTVDPAQQPHVCHAALHSGGTLAKPRPGRANTTNTTYTAEHKNYTTESTTMTYLVPAMLLVNSAR